MTQEERWLLEEKYGGEESAAFDEDRLRLQDGEPLAYLIGHIPFLGCKIYLDSRPLIPRPETEFWVEEALQRIMSAATKVNQPLRVLDLCAGSGCIGVAVAKALPEAEVTFVEIDPAHLPTIAKNCEENSIEKERVLSVAGDLYDPVTGRYDFILCNPPYIDTIIDRAEPSVKKYEPHQALYGGKDGVEVIFRVIHEAKRYLTATGQLWIEHEPEQVLLIRALANTRGFVCRVGYDQYKTARFSVLTVE